MVVADFPGLRRAVGYQSVGSSKAVILDLRIQAAIEVIQNAISGKVEIETVARQTNVSASRLRHVFKAEMGLSLTQYIKRKRMQEAEHLLRTTFLSVKEIAHRVGFGNDNSFSREFHRTHGLAPGKYRARSREVDASFVTRDKLAE